MDAFSLWNKHAHTYLRQYGEDPSYDAWYAAWYAHLPHQGRVLEWGCGPGIMAHRVLARRSDLVWLGYDPAEAMVALAAEHVPGAHFEVKHTSEAWPPGPFDGVAAAFLIPYLNPSQLQDFLRQTTGVLRKHGAVFLSWIDQDGMDASAVEVNGAGDQMTVNYHSEHAVKQALALEGFHIAAAHACPAPPSKKGQVYRAVVAILQHD